MIRCATGVALAMVLAGCSRSEPEQPAPSEPVTETIEGPEPTPPPIVPAPLPSPTVTPTPAAPPPPPPVEPDEQMLDDASATGMTARSEREDVPIEQAPSDGSTVP
jgi:PBP1b-binding outer membrane lipoprotein LpoB